ncbi:MAG: HlyD family efflux transporter periplasmic adaptor subunit [Solirubrobacteraceae bacterium]
MTSARQRTPQWLTAALGAGALALIVLAAVLVGPPEQAASVQTRVVTVRSGVVQSTVSGSGNIQAATQLNLGFKTAGTVQRIYVTQGEYVTSGKLLAELNPQSAEVTLEQAKASLRAAEATLSQEEENGGETSSGQSGGSSAAGGKPTASTAVATTASVITTTAAPPATTPARTTPTTSTSPTTPTSTDKTPSTSTGKTPSTSTGKTPSTTKSSSSMTTSEKSKQSAATREANLASARASVKSARLAVQSDEQSVANTRLYAPDNGTIVSLSGEVGESVSGGGTSKASTSASSSSTAAGSTAGTGAGSTAGTGAATSSGRSSSGSSSGSSSSSSSAFAVLSDLGTMQLVVPLSESEIVHVHVGQPATVTVEALEGLKLAAHVVSVATLSTSNSGVVSYPVTFQLDQAASALKPGMSASAEVVVKQQEGINVPTSAISGRAVTVVRGGKRVRQAVIAGLAGNSSTIVLSGLKAGEEIVLPIATTSGSTSSTSITSRLGGRSGGALGGGSFGGSGFPGGGRGGG